MQQDVQMSNSILIVKKHRRADFDVVGGGIFGTPFSPHLWYKRVSEHRTNSGEKRIVVT